MPLATDLQAIEPGAVIEMFVIDAANLGAEVYRWHPGGPNELGIDVVWQGETYESRACAFSGAERAGTGTLARPKFEVANVFGIVGALSRQFDNFRGATFTRKRTFAKYLDAVNFSGGNAQADPNTHFPDETYQVVRMSDRNESHCVFELAAGIDLAHVMLPRRQLIDVCGWGYRSAECGYAGAPVADEFDAPTTQAGKDVCGKRLTSCKLRFGANGQLPFGGFPSAGTVR